MLFFGVLLLIFFQVVRPQDFVPGLIGLPLVWYSMLVSLILLLFAPIEKKPIRSPQDKFLGLYLIAAVISTLTLFWIPYALEVIDYAVKFALMYYFIVIVVQDERKLKQAVWTTVVFMFMVALMGVLQYHGYDIAGGMTYAADKGVWQIIGIGMFDNPNYLACGVVLVVPFALGLLIRGKGFLGRASAIAFLSVSIYCIYLTRSRGGQLALGAALVTWAFFWAKSPKWRKRIFVSAAAALLVLFAIQTGGFREDASAMGRVDAWTAGWAMLKGHPLIGVGKDQFLDHAPRDSHNSYVQAGGELGLFGLYAFVGILYYSALTIYRMWDRSDPEKWRIYYAGFGGYLNSYIVSSIFSSRAYDLLFLTCMALTGIMGRLSLEATELVNTDGVIMADERIINKTVFGLTSLILIVWYTFLRRAY